ncbi:carboxypeptidase B-like [Trichogramma pretiosum]|uniref:carboxypeptidase B-like n=1 Tax=Trichogramma pretiosum TaxID=7493 RepID=UPI000C71C630|nr:carboxypeptidase B-like [Trichogramma pretiosum]
MKYSIFSLFLLYEFLVSESHEDKIQSIYGMQSFAINCNVDESRYEYLNDLANDPSFDFIKTPSLSTCQSNVTMDVLVPAQVVKMFKKELIKRNISFDVYSEDISNEIHERKRRDIDVSRRIQRLPSAFFENYRSYQEMKEYCKVTIPNLNPAAKYVKIGTSLERRTIFGVKFTTDENARRPMILLDAGIHAREWISHMTALYIISQLAKLENRHIYDEIDIVIIPNLNPDGYEYSRQKPENRLWRKNRSSAIKKCRGVDLNRNFDTHWTSGIGSSDDPCAQTYKGKKAFSEPESRALRDFMKENKDRIKIYVTLHSYGNYFMYPWLYMFGAHWNYKLMDCIAHEAHDALHKVRGTTYKIGPSGKTLHVVSAASADYAAEKMGIDIAYVLELPAGPPEHKFHPKTSEIRLVGRETFAAFKTLTPYALKKGPCVDGTSKHFQKSSK